MREIQCWWSFSVFTLLLITSFAGPLLLPIVMASSYGSFSDGTQDVIDDIADRRRRLHFVKDRRASMERDQPSGDDRKKKYRAWGRTPSGIIAESVMTPKEINLFWGWFTPLFNVENKFDYVPLLDLMKQLLAAGAFEDEAEALSFLHSVGREKEDLICFSEILISIASYDITPDHVFALRQFTKKIKGKRKEKKKRISNYSLEINFPIQEETEKGKMTKSKSEIVLGVLPKLGMLPVNNDEAAPSSALPSISKPSSGADSGAGQTSGKRISNSHRHKLLTTQQSSSQSNLLVDRPSFSSHKSSLADEMSSKIPFSSSITSSSSTINTTDGTSSSTNSIWSKPTSSSSLVRRRLPLRTELSDKALPLPLLSPRFDPDDSSRSFSPMTINSSVVPPPAMKSPRKLQPMADVASSASPVPVITALRSPRLRDKVRSARLDQVPAAVTPRPSSTGEAPSSSPTDRESLLRKKAKSVKIVLDPGSEDDLSVQDERSLSPGSSPAQPLKSCLKAVRKEFTRQLSRMSSSENILLQQLQHDEDAPTKPLAGSMNIDVSRNSIRTKRSMSGLQASSSSRNLLSARRDDEDQPTPTLGARPSLRRSNSQTQGIDRVESARQLIKRVDSMSQIMDEEEQRARAQGQGGQPRASSASRSPGGSKPKKEAAAASGSEIRVESSSSDEGAGVLKNFRRTFSRQLSRMSSYSEGDDVLPRRASTSSLLQQEPVVASAKKGGSSRDSMDDSSLESFGSGNQLVRTDRQPRMSRGSFGETIILRSHSSGELDI